MSGANVIRGPWSPRTRCDGCAKAFPEGHIIGPVYFCGEPYQLCFGCDGGDRAALLSAAQKARKRAGRTP